MDLQFHNYITPTHFLESASMFTFLLTERSSEIKVSKDKLASGLAKLVQAREGVEMMRASLREKRAVCAQSQKECENLLVEIVSERRLVDEQRKQIDTDSHRIAEEELKFKIIATNADADIEAALPALHKAMIEVENLDKAALSELKAYKAPPKLVEMVLAAVMILFRQPTDWNTAKKFVGDNDFLTNVKNFDKGYVNIVDFSSEAVTVVSRAAGALCTWVHAIYTYASLAIEIAPKRAALKIAEESLFKKQEALKEAQEEFYGVTNKIKVLKEKYDTSITEKNRLKADADEIKKLLDRADSLVTGLTGEDDRWKKSLKQYDIELSTCIGNALMAAAFFAYAGPFDSRYRHDLVQQWLGTIRQQTIPLQEQFSLKEFCCKTSKTLNRHLAGLPGDDFSAENACIATQSRRFPLCIDPQGQAKRWISTNYGETLIITDFSDLNVFREIEHGITFGLPVLLKDIGESIDPALEPVLARSTRKVGKRIVLNFGDKELDWSTDFKLFLTTRLSSPHYTPEVSMKTSIINFSVVQEGLEAQLLGTIVASEMPALEQQSIETLQSLDVNKKQVVELGDAILRLLSESPISLLDSTQLIDALQISKFSLDKVKHQLKGAEDTLMTINARRDDFRPAAARCSIVYFALADMGRVDTMYAYSLDSYVELLLKSLEDSRSCSVLPSISRNQQGQHSSSTQQATLKVVERSKQINAYHTLAVYQYACCGLFDHHKVLFSLQLCLRILMSEGKLSHSEFEFVCLGRTCTQRAMLLEGTLKHQRRNPSSDWLETRLWENVVVLDTISTTFSGLASSFEQAHREWRLWFYSPEPENKSLPADWENKLTELQRLCVIRALRYDRFLFAVKRFVRLILGQQFVEPPSFNLRAIYQSSTAKTPLIFILSSGCDPTQEVTTLAHNLNQIIDVCALGQGQTTVALGCVNRSLRRGSWTLLANCFPASDHQLLTNKGWMFLDDVRNYKNTDLMFAGYDPKTRKIIYEKALCLQVTGRDMHKMIECTIDDAGLAFRKFITKSSSALTERNIEQINHSLQKHSTSYKSAARKVKDDYQHQWHEELIHSISQNEDNDKSYFQNTFQSSCFSIMMTEDHDIYCDVGASHSSTNIFGKIKGQKLITNVAFDSVRFMTLGNAEISLSENSKDIQHNILTQGALRNEDKLCIEKPVLSKSRNEIRKIKYKGRCWCAEMPSGFVVVRRVTAVSGNTFNATIPIIQGNCHLVLSWLPILEKVVEDFCVAPMDGGSAPNINFRLWLSSSPTNQFPVAILQRGIKISTESPRGLRAIMLHLYSLVSEEQFSRCTQNSSYRRLLFALAWFHSVLLERCKFKNMGFNIPYEFNDSDFNVCHDLLILILNEYSECNPLDAIRYLIAEGTYGGRVSDILDRRLISVYMAQIFREDLVDYPSVQFNLAPQLGNESPYVVFADTDFDSIKEIISTFPQNDVAATFGQHMNAEISSHIDDSNQLLNTLTSLHGNLSCTSFTSCEIGHLNISSICEQELLETCRQMSKNIPQPISIEEIHKIFESRLDPLSLSIVLFQELDRYNGLLTTVRQSLCRLELCLQGQAVATVDLQDILSAIRHSKVPDAWASCYPSLKPLASWVKDLCKRIDAMYIWAEVSMPFCFWLPSFTYPIGFLTALLQATARRTGIPIDRLSWDFPVFNLQPEAITSHAKDGAYVHGLFLEGARFDPDHSHLVEQMLMELIVPFYILHFRPIDSKRRTTNGIYACPLFMYPIRTGTRERPSFVVTVDLGSGAHTPEFWTTQGTALLLSTSD